jgi:iron complex transport system permease protein
MRPSRWLLLFLLLAIAMLAAVSLGTLHLDAVDVFRGALGTGTTTQVAAALQCATRNGLAEPYLLGVSGGAAVGAVLAVAVHAAAPLVPLAGFAGALAAVALTLAVARGAGGRGDPRVVLMAGVVVGAFANAAIMVALADADANVVRGALWWMMGSVADASWMQVRLLAPYVVLGVGALALLGPAIDLLALGEDAAAGMGANVARLSMLVYVAAALLAAGTVAAAGLVGFVGLLVPHLVRLAGARTHRTIITGAALAGAILVVAADLVARVARPPAELPLGAVTAILGVPFFLARLRRLA